MPSVATKGTKVPTATAKLVMVPTITATEVIQAIESMVACRAAEKQARDLKKPAKAALMLILTKVLGVKNSSEIKHMSPDEISELWTKRVNEQAFIVAKDAPDFSIINTYEGARPKWKDELQKRMGEAVVNEIQANTPKSYSYAVVDSNNIPDIEAVEADDE